MPTKNRTSVLMTLPPECARATAMPINPCTGAPGATPHWTCIAANPPGHASPPGTHGTGGKRSLPAGRPVRPVYQSDQIRTREGYRGHLFNHQSLLAFIWSVADLLRGDYKQSDYGKVILPFTVLRRLDCVLGPTKAVVLAELADKQKAGLNPE